MVNARCWVFKNRVRSIFPMLNKGMRIRRGSNSIGPVVSSYALNPDNPPHSRRFGMSSNPYAIHLLSGELSRLGVDFYTSCY